MRAVGPWVILVEEDQVTRCLLANVLRGAGYRVQTSSLDTVSGPTSVGPGLIIVGTLPPAQLARALEVYPGVPVLAITEAAAISADAYLPGPFGATDLLDAVRVLLLLSAAREAETRETLVDVGAVLEVALRLASEELSACAKVTREFDTQLRVRANPEQLCLVFLHLLTTAASRVRHGGPGANGIRVAGWRTAEGRTVVEISDTGAAIPAARLTALFDATGVTEHSALGPGRRGIDLATSQRLITARGGAITVSSEVGGTRFRVELPTARA